MAEETRKLTGKKVLLIALAFFGTVIAVNLVFVFLSLSTFNGVTVEKAYYKGRDYNETLEQARAQHALGWTFHPTFVEQGIAFSIEKDGAAIAGLTGEVEIKRPIDNAYDQIVPLEQMEDGRYLARADMPLKGKWLVFLSTQAPDGTPVRQEFDTWRK